MSHFKFLVTETWKAFKSLKQMKKFDLYEDQLKSCHL